MSRVVQVNRLVNLTPHPVVLVGPGGQRWTVEPDPRGPARCAVGRVRLRSLWVDGAPFLIPVNATVMGDVYGLPEPEDGVVYIVARPVAENVRGLRPDVLTLDELVRDERGVVVGARALAEVR